MSAKAAGDKTPEETDKKTGDISEECLNLMRFNYENLDRAVRKAHQFSWFMTSIFVPAIFGGLGYLMKELDKIGPFSVVAGATVVVGVTWFWYAFTRILDGFNHRRVNQLRKLEEAFDKYYPPGLVREGGQFVQYRRVPGAPSRLHFKPVALAFAIFLTVVSVAAAMPTLMMWLCKAAHAKQSF